MCNKISGKTIIGLTEKIKVVGKKKEKTIMAKFDTGASGNSIDKKLMQELDLNPAKKVVKIKTASRKTRKKRPLVKVVFEIKGRQFKTTATVEDRSHMKYKVLVGRRILHSNFIVDVSKNHNSHKEDDLKNIV